MTLSIAQPFQEALEKFEQRLAEYKKWKRQFIEDFEATNKQCEYDEEELDELIIETLEAIALLKRDIKELANRGAKNGNDTDLPEPNRVAIPHSKSTCNLSQSPLQTDSLPTH